MVISNVSVCVCVGVCGCVWGGCQSIFTTVVECQLCHMYVRSL